MEVESALGPNYYYTLNINKEKPDIPSGNSRSGIIRIIKGSKLCNCCTISLFDMGVAVWTGVWFHQKCLFGCT